MKQVVKGVIAALIVNVPLGWYLHEWLHGTLLFTLLACGALGLAIIVVVGTRSDQADAAADAAWREAASDLPPVSDRRTMEQAQRRIPGPDAAGSAVTAVGSTPKKGPRAATRAAKAGPGR